MRSRQSELFSTGAVRCRPQKHMTDFAMLLARETFNTSHVGCGDDSNVATDLGSTIFKLVMLCVLLKVTRTTNFP